MRTGKRFWFLCCCIFLAGCAQSATAPTTASTVSDTPTFPPTSSKASISVPTNTPAVLTLSAKGCEVFRAKTIMTDHPQGDLMAWSPKDDILAFIGGNEKQDQFMGDLYFQRIPASQTATAFANNAFGNLAWSPDASFLVYATLRMGEGLYSMISIHADGSQPIDLFPGSLARTDGWSSPKIVASWIDDRTASIFSSCGLNCASPYEADVSTGSTKLASVQQKTDVNFWEIHRHLPETWKLPFANFVLKSLNWSPDFQKIAYFDTLYNVWVFLPAQHAQFPLELGNWSYPYETKWSFDNRYLAIRTDTLIFVFDTECK